MQMNAHLLQQLRQFPRQIHHKAQSSCIVSNKQYSSSFMEITFISWLHNDYITPQGTVQLYVSNNNIVHRLWKSHSSAGYTMTTYSSRLVISTVTNTERADMMFRVSKFFCSYIFLLIHFFAHTCTSQQLILSLTIFMTNSEKNTNFSRLNTSVPAFTSGVSGSSGVFSLATSSCGLACGLPSRDPKPACQ